MYVLRCILLFFLLSSALSIKSLNSRKDSLLNIINTIPDDTNKVNALSNLARQYDYFNSRERIEYFITALNLSEKLNFKNGIVKVSILLITNLSHRRIYDVALEYCNKYIVYLKENNLQKELQENYKLYATLLSKQGKYKESLDYNFKALNYYLSKADEIQYAVVLNNICLLHQNNNYTDSAWLYGLRAMEIFRKNNRQSELANIILGLAEISLSRKNYSEAKTKALDALDIYKNINVELGILNSYYVLGNIEAAGNRNDSAIALYDKALKLLENFPLYEMKRDCYLSLSKSYAALKKPELAYANHILFSAYKDSVAEEHLKAKTLEMDAKYSITKKESELKEKEFIIQNQSKQRNLLILGLTGIIILLLISYKGYIQKKKANQEITEQKRLVDEKQKEIIDSIRYAKRIQQSLLPTNKYIDKKLNKLKD